MGALADIYDMSGNTYTPPQDFAVIPGGAKLTKDGKVKQTPNNGCGSHFVYPIKEREKVVEMAKVLWGKVVNPNARKRDLKGYGRAYLYFVIGVNTGFRYSDMINLTWGHFFCKDMKTFHSNQRMATKREQKTGKIKPVVINDTIKQAIQRYIERFNPDLTEDTLIFSLAGQRIKENTREVIDEKTGKVKKIEITSYTIINMDGSEITYDKDDYKPVLSDTMVGNFIKEAATHVGIDYPVCTHTPRKTYAWLMRVDNMDNPASMPLVSEALNHANESVTRKYFGLDRDMLIDMELKLNAGW